MTTPYLFALQSFEICQLINKPTYIQKCSHNENKTAKTTYNNIQVLVEYYTSNK